MLAEQLGGAHQRGGTLELLSGQQAQRVTHQHGDAVASVYDGVALADDALHAPGGQRVRDQTEVGLGFAATGREEQQVGEPAGLASLRVGRIGERRDAQQDERQLERPPRPVGGLVGVPDSIAQTQLGVRASGFDSDGVDALFPHGLVSEPERVESVGVAAHKLDPNRDSLRGLLSPGDDLPHGHLMSAEPGVRVADPQQLTVEPCPIALSQRQQSRPQVSGLQLRQHSHVGDQPGQLRCCVSAGGVSAPHLVAGDHRGGSAHSAAGIIRADLDVGADAVPDSKLHNVSVLQVELRYLGLLRNRTGRRPGDDLAPAQKHRRAVGGGQIETGLEQTSGCPYCGRPAPARWTRTPSPATAPPPNGSPDPAARPLPC